ncbi:helix-turn-helix transcriptional regulator [Mucilaginibacter pallidiroseus]|uniref:Helix-turn-helix transcriptional regulator n=1 Tax=Mucilaginibacter pallidiroseus TaxID=2599295 RepID=A0A563UC61_9SPHI|nr:helix-turn-helix transcriptional regulator [Mucilaginibacter pallidiroseus]TWR28873.1 helix-turn-helix transcriptional regulator [Mucilaginibacter pallidiroseus]
MEELSPVNIKGIALNIKKVRTKLGMTQAKMAKKLGITQNAYSKIERCVSKLKLISLLQISAVLKVEISDLIRCDENIAS